MKVKVCGLTNPGNINNVVKLKPDFLGFIFAEESRRHLFPNPQLEGLIRGIEIPTVGVFVDDEIDEIRETVGRFKLDFIQLHGSEKPEFVEELKNFGKVIKVFKVDDEFDFKDCLDFRISDMFLFDTKGQEAGGNGIKFSWNRLNDYTGSVPFILSGGIHLSDVIGIRRINHPEMIGVDINSGFELRPGLKNEKVVEKFMETLKAPNYES
jgi:phosphoribosylanthranilate isomerase